MQHLLEQQAAHLLIAGAVNRLMLLFFHVKHYNFTQKPHGMRRVGDRRSFRSRPYVALPGKRHGDTAMSELDGRMLGVYISATSCEATALICAAVQENPA